MFSGILEPNRNQMGPYRPQMNPYWAHIGPKWAHMGPHGPIWALMGPKDTILFKKSLILMTNHKLANKNIKGVKSKKETINVVLR